MNGYTFFTKLTVLVTKREVPVQKGSDGRIQKVDVLTPILQALPQKKKTTPYSIATHKDQQIDNFLTANFSSLGKSKIDS